MEFIILLMVNLIFCIGIYWYFRRKINVAIGTDQLRNELEELVILFNRQAETNITTLEAKLKEISDLMDSEKGSEKVAINRLENLEHQIAPMNLKEKVKRDQTHLKLQSDEVVQPRQEELIKDIISISQESKESIAKQKLIQKKIIHSPKDQLQMDYHEGKNLKELAEKYQMSIDEIKLRINLNQE